jgi:hypothetical protein
VGQSRISEANLSRKRGGGEGEGRRSGVRVTSFRAAGGTVAEAAGFDGQVSFRVWSVSEQVSD